MKRYSARSALILFSIFLFVPMCVCASPPDYSGEYAYYIGHNSPVALSLTQSKHDITFIVDGIESKGTIHGKKISLVTQTPYPMTIKARFAKDSQSFTGTFEISDPIYVQGSIAGYKGHWETYDGDINMLPQFIASQCIELDKIQEISKFRSGEGHDYSDDFESCRSMKHYFLPKSDVPYKTVKIISPVNGTITGTTEEWEGTELWKGTAIGIKPDNQKAFHLVLFHINLSKPLRVGDKVLAGQELGLSEKVSGTVSDFAVGVLTAGGHKLVSYFEVMTDSLFSEYQDRGMTSRNDAIITKEERDADPLTCIGQTFVDPGNLENWVTLN